FAMLPFCGYNMADYWGHWLKIGATADPEKLPKIYQVNWFRKDENGKFIWPGFGENSRVLAWIVERVEGRTEAEATAIGAKPKDGDLYVDGLGMSEEQIAELFAVDPQSWLAECDLTEEYFDQFGDRVPQGLRDELAALRQRLEAAQG
nr:phosphoenolpyruvate carboxykinase (GTP) [Candidatus Nanopelagicales bacterium]